MRVDRGFVVKVYEDGEDVGGTVDFELDGSHLSEPIEVGSQTARIEDGVSESLPYAVVFRPDAEILSKIWDDDGYPDVLGRVVEVVLEEDATPSTVDVRRIGAVRAQGAHVSLELVDELAFDNAVLFERHSTLQIAPYGPVERWGEVPAADSLYTDFDVIDTDGNFVRIEPKSTHRSLRIFLEALREDVIDDPQGSNTIGNFKSLRMRDDQGFAYAVVSFGDLSADDAGSVLNEDAWGDSQFLVDIPPFWVVWFSHGFSPPESDAGDFRLEINPSVGLRTSEHYPYLVGMSDAQEDFGIRDLLAAIFDGDYGGDPLRYALPSEEELPSDLLGDDGDSVSPALRSTFALTSSVRRREFLADIAKLAGLIYWNDEQGRIVPRRWTMPRRPSVDDLYVFDASTATSEPVYEVGLATALSKWRLEGLGLMVIQGLLASEGSPFKGAYLFERSYELDDDDPVFGGGNTYEVATPFLPGGGGQSAYILEPEGLADSILRATRRGISEVRIRGLPTSDAPVPGDLVVLDHSSLASVNPITGTRDEEQLARVIERRRVYRRDTVEFEYRLLAANVQRSDILLAMPVDLRVISRTATSINLGFTDDSTGEDEFKVFVDSSLDDTVPSTTTEDVGFEYDHGITGLAQDTEYDLQVQACDASGECGEITDALTALTMLSTPTNVGATEVSSSRVDVDWDNNHSADQVEIWRNENGGSFVRIDTVAFTSSYSDTSVSGGTEYRYKIKKLTSTNESELSDQSNAVTPSAAPDAPSSLLVEAHSSLCAFNLEWTNNDTYDSVEVFRGGSFLTSLSGTAESYFDSDGIGQNDTRTYTVRGVKDSVPSDHSNQSGDTTSGSCFQ